MLLILIYCYNYSVSTVFAVNTPLAILFYIFPSALEMLVFLTIFIPALRITGHLSYIFFIIMHNVSCYRSIQLLILVKYLLG